MVKRLYKLLLCTLLCCGVLLSVSAADRALAESNLSIQASAAETVCRGDVVSVTVCVAGGTSVGAACRVTFDSEYLALVEQNIPEGWTETGTNEWSYFETASDSAGWADGKILGTFEFRAVKNGTTTVTITDPYAAEKWDDGASDTLEDPCDKQDATINIRERMETQQETTEYVAGYSMLIVYTDGSEGYSYNGVSLYDVSGAGYTTDDGLQYLHVYASVVEGEFDQSKLSTTAKPNGSSVDYSKRSKLSAEQVQKIYNTNAELLNNMETVLLADVNHDKIVDVEDTITLSRES